MKFRRWLALLATTALALTLLTGCGTFLPHPSTWTIENGTLYVPYGARTLTREQVEQVGRPFTGVALPATLREIGEGAFEGNTQLQRVQFGTEQADSPVNSSAGWIDLTGSGVALAGLFWDGGLTIGERAFYNCDSLSQVTGWGSSVSIGAYSFRGTNIYGATDLSNVVYIGEYAFEDCWGIIGQVSLHNAAYIGENAFAGCTGITGGLDLSSATSIGAGAFSGCTGLSGEIVMDKVETIGANAFEGCTGVASVRYSERAEVAENAFSGVSAVINGAPAAGGGGGGGGGSAPAVLNELKVSEGPTKTSYTEGETFNPTGLTLTATYDNGITGTIEIKSSADAKAKGVTWTPDELTKDTTEVTISYTHNSVTQTATVTITVKAKPITNLQLFIERIEEARKEGTLASTIIEVPINYNPKGGQGVPNISDGNGNLTGTLDCGGATVILKGGNPLINTIELNAKLQNLKIKIEKEISFMGAGLNYGTVAVENKGNIIGCDVSMVGNGSIITSKGIVGGIVVTQSGGTIQNCSVTGGSISSYDGNVGGIAGTQSGGTIQNCSVTNSKITTNDGDAGGIAGNQSGGTIQYCSVTGGRISSYDGNAGNIAGNQSGTVIN